MKNKGFTLVELMGVVLLLGLLTLVIVPKVLEQTEKKEKQLDKDKQRILFADTGTYINENVNIYQPIVGKVYCIKVQTLIDEDVTSVDVNSFNNYYVKASVDDNENFVYDLSLNCTKK